MATTNKRRLINFRGTRDFALVGNRSGSTSGGSTKWASCEKPPTESISYAQQVTFFTTITTPPPSQFSRNPRLGAGVENPVRVITNGGMWQAVKPWRPWSPLGFDLPCTPANAADMVFGFEEPDFNTFQQQYAAYLAGRVPTPPSIPPMESN